ncbi:DUF2157 domain-containing protein [Bacillus salitolerans]|uniref:DUF2157 domain-containing protein n=1 Tax=Bacillus salitolerans TaxID=1437434 RepID=A0ABW4LR65_9BACI
MKREVTTFQYNILKRELLYLEEIGELSPNQAESFLQHYFINDHQSRPQKQSVRLNFIQIITMIGSILIGLGVLSFVASNWSAMSTMEKFSLLLVTLFIAYAAAWLLEEKKPVTSRALYYIGAFMYGAEIFYIGQMFHLGGNIGTAFMAWAIGIIPLAFYLKDKVLYGAGYGLFYLSIQLNFMTPASGDPSLWMLIILPLLFVAVRYTGDFSQYLIIANFFLLYQFVELKVMIDDTFHWFWIPPILLGLFALSKFVFPKEPYLVVVNFFLLYQFAEFTLFLNGIDNVYFALLFGTLTVFLIIIGHKFMKKSVILFIINVILSIQFIFLILIHLNIDVLFFYFFISFLVGIVFTHFTIEGYKEAMKWIGYLFQLVSGIVLTIPIVYDGLPEGPVWMFFGLAYIVYGVYLVYKNKLFGVLIVSILIFRFYVDLSLVFMNKSIAFLIGGILLLCLGFWFEKTRRGDGKYEQKKSTK